MFVQAVGTFILLGPSAFIFVTSASGLTGGPTLPALAGWPATLRLGLIPYFFASFVMVAVCILVAYGLRLRVKYVSLDQTFTAPGQ